MKSIYVNSGVVGVLEAEHMCPCLGTVAEYGGSAEHRKNMKTKLSILISIPINNNNVYYIL